MRDIAQLPWADLAQANLPRMIDFCQRMIRTPSLSGQEGAMAALVASEMRILGYDEVWIDAVGNVIGAMKGSRPGKGVMFNSHLDHVSPGDDSVWKHPPYGGVVDDGAIWGVGASDTKGALAAQVYGIAGLRQAAPDFAGVGRSFGVPARNIARDDEISSAFEWLWESPEKPALLEVSIDTFANAYPKVKFGCGLDEMEP